MPTRSPVLPPAPVRLPAPARPLALYADMAAFTGAELRTLREARGLSRPRLARLIGYSPWAIKDWERGRRAVPESLPPVVYEALDGVAAERRTQRQRYFEELEEEWDG